MYKCYAAQVIPQIDAEIAEKGHFWMETTYEGGKPGYLKPFCQRETATGEQYNIPGEIYDVIRTHNCQGNANKILGL